VATQLEVARRCTRRLRRDARGKSEPQRLAETVERLEKALSRIEALTAQSQEMKTGRRREQSVDVLDRSGAAGRRLLESNLFGVIVFETDGAITEANDYFLNLVGYSRADLRAGRLNWRAITPPDHEAADARAFEEITHHSVCTPFEKEYFRCDGGRVPVLVAATLFEPGASRGLAFVLDMTARRQAQDLLRAAHDELEQRVQRRTADLAAAVGVLRAEIEERERAEARLAHATAELRAILEAFPDLHFRLGAEGDIREYYAGSTADLHAAPEDLLGRKAGEVLPAEVARQIHEAIGRVLDSGAMTQIDCELPIRGVEEHYEVRIVPFGTNETMAVVRNVNERYEAEAALRESEERFESAFKYAPIGMALVGLEGRPFQVNRALCDMLGYSEAELLERSVGEVTHPDDLPEAYTQLQRLLAGQCETYRLEKRYFHKDGRLVWGRLSASLVRDAAGNPRYVITQVEDITAQRAADACLRESEQRFTGAFLSAPSGMALVSLDGHPIQVNPALCEMLGYTEQEMLTLPVAEVMHPEDLDAALADRERLVSGEVSSYQSERRYFHKSGRVVWTQMSVSLVRHRDGHPLYLVSHLGDITARKKAEEALRQSEERFALAVAGSKDGLWDWNILGREIFISPRAKRILGYGANEFEGRLYEWDERLYPEDRDRVHAETLAHLNGATPHLEMELRVRHKDGTYRWILVRGLCIRDAAGLACRMAGSITDITERKGIEEDLRRSEERYALAVAGANDGLWDWDLRANELYISPRWTEIVGADDEGVVTSPLDQWRHRLHPEDYSRVAAEIAAHLWGDSPHYHSEHRLRHNDGTYRWVLSRGVARRDAQGQPYRIAGSVTDITDRVRAEEALWQARDELEARVAQRTAELEQANRLLLEGMAQRREIEEALRENEQRFREIFNQAAVGIAQVGLDGRWRLVNQRFCDILGYTREELRATSFHRIAHPHDLDGYVETLRRLLANETQTEALERRLVRKDGSSVWGNLTASLVREPSVQDVYVAMVLEDIGERKLAEEQRREAELRYRRLVEQLPAITYVQPLDAIGKTLYISPQVESMLGFSREEWMADADLWGRQIVPEDRARVLTERARSLTVGDLFSCEYRVRTRDGRVLWLRDEAVTIRDDGGRAMFSQGVMIDMTEGKRSAEQVEALSERLRNILEGIADGFLAVDGQGCLAYMNSSAAKLLRVDRVKAIGKTVEDVLPESLGSPFYQQYRQVISERVAVDVEAYYPPLSRWLRARAYPSAEGMSVLFEDISERHAHEVAIVGDILQALNAHVDIADALPEVAAGLHTLIDCDHCDVSLFDELCEWASVIALDPDRRVAREMLRYRLADSPVVRDILAGQAHVVPDLATELDFDEVRTIYQAGYRSRATLPLCRQDQVIGMLNLAWRQTDAVDVTLLPVLGQVADALALAVEKNNLFDEVRDGEERLRLLSRKLMEVQEAERRFLAGELHDEIGQGLTALRLVLDAVDRLAPQGVRARLEDAHKVTNDLIARVRSLSLDLRPPMLDDLGLLAALLWLFDRYTTQTRVQVAFAHHGLERRFAPDVETAAFRIVQEALTNVARHAGVSRVTVRAWADAASLEVQVTDEGRGFNADAAMAQGTSSGLAGMRERAVLLGGSLSVESAPGTGACLSAHLPLRVMVDEVGL